jgi:hypothetical protein
LNTSHPSIDLRPQQVSSVLHSSQKTTIFQVHLIHNRLLYNYRILRARTR